VGRDVRQPENLLYGTVSNTENFDNLSDYVHNIRTYLDTVHEFAREHINNASDKQKFYQFQVDYKVHGTVLTQNSSLRLCVFAFVAYLRTN
jgi:hypothetical protein